MNSPQTCDVISLSRANQSQAKFKSAVGRNLLQSWENLTLADMANLGQISGDISEEVTRAISTMLLSSV